MAVAILGPYRDNTAQVTRAVFGRVYGESEACQNQVRQEVVRLIGHIGSIHWHGQVTALSDDDLIYPQYHHYQHQCQGEALHLQELPT